LKAATGSLDPTEITKQGFLAEQEHRENLETYLRRRQWSQDDKSGTQRIGVANEGVGGVSVAVDIARSFFRSKLYAALLRLRCFF
jgi:hypothetical protein